MNLKSTSQVVSFSLSPIRHGLYLSAIIQKFGFQWNFGRTVNLSLTTTSTFPYISRTILDAYYESFCH